MAHWSSWHRHVVVKLVSQDIWTQKRDRHLHGLGNMPCQLFREEARNLHHRFHGCPTLQAATDARTSQERQGRSTSSSTCRTFPERLGSACLKCPSQLLPGGSRQDRLSSAMGQTDRPCCGMLEVHRRCIVRRGSATASWLGRGGNEHNGRLAVCSSWACGSAALPAFSGRCSPTKDCWALSQMCRRNIRAAARA